jgi:predicted ATP-dependent Lon-type protease
MTASEAIEGPAIGHLVARLRLLVLALGERAEPPWWRTNVLSAAGRSFCERLFPRSALSAVRNRRVQAGTAVLGDLTVQGNIRGPSSITELLQMLLESGAVRVLVPISNKAQFAGLPEDVVEKLDTVFYGDVDRAVLKTLEN